MNQHVLRIGGREYRAHVKDITSDRAVVVVDGTEYAIDLVKFGRRAASPDAVRVAPVAAPPATAAAPVAPAAPRATGVPRGAEGGTVAPMPGLVLSIVVKEGDSVAAGQTLLIMEAMKMENAITASHAGTVAKIYVREGDSIGEGDLLVQVSRPSLTSL